MRVLSLLILWTLATNSTLAQDAPATKIFIDLQPKAVKPLTDVLNDGAFPGDNLADLPQGKFNTSDGVEFQVGPKCVVLFGKFVPDRPAEIDGFNLGAKIDRLQILHGCGWGAFGGKANPAGHYQEDGTLVGHYRVNYADGDWGIIPIVYGRDVRDWWAVWDNFKPTMRTKVAWRGTNDQLRKNPATQGIDDPLRLFVTDWRNPRPQVAITSIDIISEKQVAAPFCVAITAVRADSKTPIASASDGSMIGELLKENAALKNQLERLQDPPGCPQEMTGGDTWPAESATGLLRLDCVGRVRYGC